MIGTYVIARTYSAGVFAGTLTARDGKEATLTDGRRLWYWDGAASLSELVTAGTAKPGQCKFPAAVAEVVLTEVIELLSVTAEAKASIEAVPVWSAR